MLSQRARLITNSLFIFDVLLTAASFFLAYWLRDYFFSDRYGHLYPIEYYLWLLIITLPVWSFLLYYFGVYESFRTNPLWMEPWKVLKAVCWGIVVVGMLVFAFKLERVSRLFLLAFGAVDILLLSAEKVTLRLLAAYVRKKGYNYRNILIVGTGRRAREIAKLVDGHRHWGLRLLGFVAENGFFRKRSICGHSIVGAVEDIPGILKRRSLTKLSLPRPSGGSRITRA